MYFTVAHLCIDFDKFCRTNPHCCFNDLIWKYMNNKTQMFAYFSNGSYAAMVMHLNFNQLTLTKFSLTMSFVFFLFKLLN